ncbi:MAG: peptide ABC transporter substrate-binding protein [Alphaproteobacteria bacterium]|nr:peptide ABC transporter substrate-binding protein [Alphaproteobacteria bacterium]
MVRSLILAVAVMLAAPALADGVLRRANGNEPGTLDPQKYTLVSEDTIARDLFEGLTTEGPDNEIVPGQAESWTVSTDGLAWTFHLRAGLLWSDGAPVAAGDFVAAAQRLVDPATAAGLPDWGLKLKNARAILAGTMPPGELGISAPDDRTVVVTLSEPSPLVPYLFSQTPLFPVPRHVLAKTGAAWTAAGTMVTNGPYRLDQWLPYEMVRIVKNPHFWQADRVQIEAVEFYPSDDQEAALKQFRAGAIDFIPQVQPAKLDWARAIYPSALALVPIMQVRYLSLNRRGNLFDDLRVRRALAMALDRETVATRLVHGGGQPAYGLVPRGIRGYEGALFDFAGQSQAERMTEARRLLREAGYGPDHRLKVDLRVPSEAWTRPVASALVSMWEAVGVDVSLRAEEARVHYAALRTGDYDIALSSWFANADPEQFFWLFQTGGGVNDDKYSNAEVDRLSHQADRTLDMAERYRVYAAAEKVLLDDVGTIPLFWTVQGTLTSDRVQGLKLLPDNSTRSRYAVLVK